MKIKELAYKIHVHRVHAWRLASAGIIPATKKTKGGHFYFVKCRQLTRWINFMQSGGAFRKKELARAYQKGYGKIRPENEEQIKCWKLFKYHRKKSAETRKRLKSYINQYDDLFEGFFYNTEDLINILKEITTWPDTRVKEGMLKASRERLALLRDLINEWLNQQQSSRT